MNDKELGPVLDDIQLVNGISAINGILRLICEVTGMGFAVIARVTKQDWIACAVNDNINFGLAPGGGLALNTTICHEIEQHRQPVIIDNVLLDPYYQNHPTPALYGFKSYISFPIMLSDGSFFGTLCSIDPNPAQLNNFKITEIFKSLADLIAFHIESRKELETGHRRLAEEQQQAEWREQMIAVLGHDLKNPVSALLLSTEALQQSGLNPMQAKFSSVILNTGYRIKGLSENLHDFASTRLGSGMQLTVEPNQALELLLQQIITELQTVFPGRSILPTIEPGLVAAFDKKRMAQLFSNLLGNALIHGDPTQPVQVNAIRQANEYLVTISNGGKKIPAENLEHIFQPFYRANTEGYRQGLGLGLYIAAQIAKAHHGRLEVYSDDTVTSFSFYLPV